MTNGGIGIKSETIQFYLQERKTEEIKLKKDDTFDIPLEQNLFLGKRGAYGSKEKGTRGIAKTQ